jgi:alcohol/geraniol dehydrogenase (NADP+)
MLVQAMAIARDGKALSPQRYELAPLKPDEVLIQVSHCGVCRGDLRLFRRPDQRDPTILVPGHEIVGYVIATGEATNTFRAGDRVGVGWQSGSCRTCEWCRQGEPELCPAQEETCIMRPGGYATHVKVQADFVVPIPPAIDSCYAAPLLCGGLAVYSPLKRYNLKPGAQVGVVGIGGLGHLALQFCRAFGLHALAFSTSSNKANDARELGAEAFIQLGDHSSMKKMESSCDFILSTSAGNVEWRQLLKLLRPGGTLCAVGVASSEIQLPVSELIDERKTIAGSPIGSPKTLCELLDFVSEHGIRPWTEPFRMSNATQAIARLERGEIRYRAVLQQDLS